MGGSGDGKRNILWGWPNQMNEQTENNKETNCFLEMFIRKCKSLPLKGIHITLTGSCRIRSHK